MIAVNLPRNQKSRCRQRFQGLDNYPAKIVVAADGEVGSALNFFEGKRVRLLVAGQVAVQPGGQSFRQLPALRPVEVGVMLSVKQCRQFRREFDPIARQRLAGALVPPAEGRDHGQ